MPTQVSFHFYVVVDSSAGMDVEETVFHAEFDTDDCEHAMELAERYWPTVRPANFMPGTLTIV